MRVAARPERKRSLDDILSSPSPSSSEIRTNKGVKTFRYSGYLKESKLKSNVPIEKSDLRIPKAELPKEQSRVFEMIPYLY
jgi:hypothetical protein